MLQALSLVPDPVSFRSMKLRNISRFLLGLWVMVTVPLPAFAGRLQGPSLRGKRPEWAFYAMRLSGESEKVRRHALRRLRLIDDLNRRLVEGLRTRDRGLALDTIAALQLEPLLPVLIADSVHDGDGQIHLTLDALISRRTRDELSELFRAQLQPAEIHRLSAASLIAILDGFVLMSENLPAQTLFALLRDPSYEVRIATVLYAREMSLKAGATAYLPILKAALRSHPRELRLEASHAIESLQAMDPTRAGASPARSDPTAEEESASFEDSARGDDSGRGEEEEDTRAAPPDLFSQAEGYLRRLGESEGTQRGCRVDYRRFFRLHQVDIRIVFGYQDARPARFVGDRYERAALIEHLTQPCSGGYQACGFIRDWDSAVLLSREITGPDGNPVRVMLHVADSSWSPDDDLNRGSPDQRIKTARARRIFLQGLTQADAVLYLGHSRDGGGPDFGPPRIRFSDRHVDYAWYHSHRRGWRMMMDALRHSRRRPSLLALFSCFAGRHFASGLRRDFPRMGLITSPGWAYADDELVQVVATVDSLLGMRCRAGFEAALGPLAGLRVRGFFNKIKKKT